jgi:hypothetical protein
MNWLTTKFNTLPPVLRHGVSGAATILMTAILAYIAGLFNVKIEQIPVPVIPAVVPAVVEDTPPPPPPVMAFGWHRDDEEVKVVKAAIRTVFRATPAGANEDLPNAVFQWKVHKEVTGYPAPEKDQNPVGSCVGFGNTTAYERALVCAIKAGEPFEFTRFSEEAAYAISRVQIGKGELRGEDGSVGAWAARANVDFGMLPAAKYADGDFTTYNPTRCRQLGDKGLPKALLDEAAKYKAGSVAHLKSWLDAKKAMAAGAGVFTCSMQGYAAQRDKNGVCQPSGRWGHCMCLDGYYVDAATGREYGHFDNSWDGVYHKGPTGWGQPSGTGFWADARVISQMIGEGDSWAVSAVKGFPKLGLDWFAQRPTIRRPLIAKFEDLFSLAH